MTTTPATPPTPPVRPTPPVKSSEEYFNSSRLKVIGLITAATVAVGALGGIAGVAFDPDPVEDGNVVQPGGQGLEDPGAPGNSVAGRGEGDTGKIRSLMTRAQSTASPSPVASATPSTGGSSTSPSPIGSPTSSPTSAPTSTSAPPSPTPSPDGGGATFANGVELYVPTGWNIDHQTDGQIYLSDGTGSYVFAFSGAGSPSDAAGDIITDNLLAILPPENYTQLQTSEVVPLQPFGSVVSVAAIEYEALWVDNQGSISVHGQIYIAVRQDGTVLGIDIEHLPAEDWPASFDDLAPIVETSFNRFAGVG